MEAPKSLSAGAIGARLAGRLTADLILRSPQYMSCIGEYEIDLRGSLPSSLHEELPFVALQLLTNTGCTLKTPLGHETQ